MQLLIGVLSVAILGVPPIIFLIAVGRNTGFRWIFGIIGGIVLTVLAVFGLVWGLGLESFN